MDEPLDLTRVRTYPIADRTNKVHVRDFGRPVGPGASVREALEALPNFLAARDLRRVARALAGACRSRAKIGRAHV